MSKYMNAAEINNQSHKTDDFQMKCEMNISNYKAMVQNNFDKLVNEGDEQTKLLANKYNPEALNEKIKGFKFTKGSIDKSSQKDTNWFSKL